MSNGYDGKQPYRTVNKTQNLFKLLSFQFHFGSCEKILFNGWDTVTVWSFVISCIGIFIAAFLYEGLRFVREQYVIQQVKREVSKCAPGCDPPVKTFKESVLNKAHIIQSLMYLIQLTVSYLLMLIAMTFNLYLFIAIIGGAFCGYFTFGWVRQRTIDDSDCCNM